MSRLESEFSKTAFLRLIEHKSTDELKALLLESRQLNVQLVKAMQHQKAMLDAIKPLVDATGDMAIAMQKYSDTMENIPHYDS